MGDFLFPPPPYLDINLKDQLQTYVKVVDGRDL